MKIKDVTIVVNTCDAYEDVWKIFFCAFDDHWKNCKYNIVLNTETKNCVIDENIKTHNFPNINGKDEWGARLRSTLHDIDSTYVIMIFDDFILEDTVNTAKIEKLIKWMNEDSNISVFYFCNLSSSIDTVCKYEDFHNVSERGNYRLNSVPAIWRKEKLLEFTGDNDSPWAWEYFGSYRTYNENNLFYCSKKDKEDTFVYNRSLGGAIYRAKWVPEVVKPAIEKYNLNIDLDNRGVVNRNEEMPKRSLKWKIDFILLGFKMIGFGVFTFIYRIVKGKLAKLLT